MKKIILLLGIVLGTFSISIGQTYYPENYEVEKEVEKAELLHPEQREEMGSTFNDSGGYDVDVMEEKQIISFEELPESVKEDLKSRENFSSNITEVYEIQSSQESETMYEIHVNDDGQNRVLMFFDEDEEF